MLGTLVPENVIRETAGQVLGHWRGVCDNRGGVRRTRIV